MFVCGLADLASWAMTCMGDAAPFPKVLSSLDGTLVTGDADLELDRDPVLLRIFSTLILTAFCEAPSVSCDKSRPNCGPYVSDDLNTPVNLSF